MTEVGLKKVSKMTELKYSLKKYWVLYLFLLIPTVYFIVIKYVPMVGNIIAFRRYKPGDSILGTEWRGLHYVKMFWESSDFWLVFGNTLKLSFLSIIFTFPLPIIFALLLNELNNKIFKKFAQSMTIIPKFLSSVVVVMIMNGLLSPSTGSINYLIQWLGGHSIFFMNEASWFRTIYIISELWQFVGWNSIIYMAALSAADVSLYEAAKVDGANRWQQTLHVTLPTLVPTIAINFVIAVSCVLNIGFEKILLMYKPNTYDTADIIATYVYRQGLFRQCYSYATAIGLFQGIIGLIFLYITNKFTKKFLNAGLW